MKRKLFVSLRKTGSRLVVFLVLFGLVFSFLANDPSINAAYSNTAIEQKTGAVDTPQSLSDGKVWTSKFVDADPSTNIIDVNVDPAQVDDTFGITLSALGQDYPELNIETNPVNVVFVLDISGSMKDENKINNAVTAINSVTSSIFAANSDSKIGVVVFDYDEFPLTDLRSGSVTLQYTSGDVKCVESGKSREVGGGTNIQIGMNRAYRMLNAEKDAGNTAEPVMIVLTDGVPGYGYRDSEDIEIYYNDYFKDGNGDLDWSTGHYEYGMCAAACTILQAAYLKTQMTDLKIYTVGYDTGSNDLAEATLNPTPANIAACDGGSYYTLNYLLNYYKNLNSIPVTDYYYPTESFFSTTLDATALTEALVGFVTEYISHKPLASGSNITITDTIPADFMRTGSLVVNLDGANHTLTESGGIYSDASLSGLTVTINGGVLTWTMPASLLPSNYYNTDGALVTVNPITLKFLVELNNVTSAGTYYTNDSADATFTPVVGNLYYYTSTTTPGSSTNYTKNGWSVKVNENNNNYTLTQIKYNGSARSVASATLDYLAYDYWDGDYKFDISVTLTDGAQIIINDIWVYLGYSKDVNSGSITVTNVNNSGNVTYTPRNIDGFSDGVMTIDMANTGMIKLKSSVASLIIKKNVVAYDGTNMGPLAGTGFIFNVNVSGYNGSGEIINSDNSHAGSFQITNGAGTFTLKDGQYAKISTITVGSSYTVSENDYSSNGYVMAVPNNAVGTIDELSNPVVFTNTYYPTATIDISKTVEKLYDSVEIATPVTFNFGLWSYDTNTNAYTRIEGVSASISSSAATYSAQMNVMIKKLADLGLFGTGSSVTLYVREGTMTGDPTGWENDAQPSTVTISKDGSVSYGTGTSAAFVNEYVPKASLTLTKATAGGTDPNGGFDFTIQLGAAGSTAFEYTYVINREDATTPETGTGSGPKSMSVSLGSNDNIVISGVPVGTSYDITENDYSAYGFSPSVGSGQSLEGTVAAGGTSVTVTNTLYKNDIKVSKTIAGGDPNAEFTFTLYKGQSVISGFTYEIGETSYTASTGTFTLKGGQTATLKELPVGTTYTVTETANAAYLTESKLNVDGAVFTEDSSVYVQLDSGSDSVPEIEFKNTYRTGSLSVSKAVLVDDNAGTGEENYTVEITFTGGYLAGITATGATETADGEYTANLTNGVSATFTGVPAGAAYNVKETVDQGADSVTYSPAQSGTISFDTQSSVQITNSFLTPATLTISKTIDTTNNLSFDTGTEFGYQIFFEKEIHHDAVPAVYEGDDLITEEIPAYDEWVPYALTSDETASGLTAGVSAGYYVFGLKGGDSIVFGNLPVGVRFEVVETDTQLAKASSASVTEGNAAVDTLDDLKVTGTIIQDADGEQPISIQYTNDFSVTTGTLQLTKTVSDPAKVYVGSFDFVVEFTGQSQGITCKYGEATLAPVADATNPMTFRITLKAAESVTFSGLLDDTQYKITELTAADSTVFTGADSTGTNDEGQAVASGMMEQNSWIVGNVKINCANTYNPPKTTTVKTASPGAVAKNTPVAYTVTVTNTSDDETILLSHIEDNMLTKASNVQFNGSDEGFTLDFNTDDGTATPRLVLDEPLEMASGATATLTYTVSFSAFGDKENTAKTYAYFGEYEITSSDTTTVTVYPDSSIDVDKVVKDEGDYAEIVDVDYLDIVTYKVTITNNNEAMLSALILSDALLSDTSIKNISATLGDSTLYTTVSANAMQFFTDEAKTAPVTLTSGQSIILTYTIKADDDHVNTASAKASDGIKEVNDSDTASVTIKTPTITVTKSGAPTSVLAGASVNYEIAIVNTYDLSLDLVSVTDTFFKLNGSGDYTVSNIRYSINGGTPIDITPGMIDTGSGAANFAFGDPTDYPSFGPEETVVITYTVTFNKAGTYTNTADVTAQYEGKNAVDNETSINSVTVEVKDPTVGYTIDKRANGEKNITVSSGSVVTYTVTVTNTGDVPLGLASLEDPMFKASGITITGLKLSDGNDLVYHLNTVDGTVEIEFPEDNWLFLKSGMTTTLTYTRAMNTSYENTVTANLYKGDESSLPQQSSSATVNITVTPPPPPPSDPDYGTLTVDKTVSGTDASATEKFAFTVTFSGNVSGIANDGGLSGSGGVYTFSLSANDAPVKFTSIPLNTSYTVTEALTDGQSDNGWTAPAASNGTIANTTPVTVTVNNAYEVGVLEEHDDDEEDETGVLGDADTDTGTLPQTGGIAFSTLLGFIGLSLVALGTMSYVLLRKRYYGKSK